MSLPTSQNAPRRPPPASLPMLDVVAQSYRVLLAQPGAWLAALLVPLAIEMAVQLAFFTLYGPELTLAQYAPQQADPMLFVRFLGMLLCLMIAYVLFAVSWHRFMLLGPGERPRLLPGVLGRHMRFAGMSFAVSLLVGLAVAVPIALLTLLRVQSVIALLLVGVLAMALFVRWQLIFPAIALDRRLTLGEAWQRSRGNALKLFWGLLLSALPWALVGAVLDDLTRDAQARFVASGQLNGTAVAAMLASGLLGYAMLGTIVGTLSGSYRHLAAEE